MVRPEDIDIVAPSPLLEAKIVRARFLGDVTEYTVLLPGGTPDGAHRIGFELRGGHAGGLEFRAGSARLSQRVDRMKISRIETFCLHCRMPYPLTYARGEYQEREALLVKVHTDEPGLFGWGEAAMWGGPWATSVAVIERELAPLAIGLDPCRPEFVWERLYQQTYYHGRKGILLACLSAIDIALWDIIGKAAGRAGMAASRRLRPPAEILRLVRILPPGLRRGRISPPMSPRPARRDSGPTR